jgi:hypothetical protein
MLVDELLLELALSPLGIASAYRYRGGGKEKLVQVHMDVPTLNDHKHASEKIRHINIDVVFHGGGERSGDQAPNGSAASGNLLSVGVA